MKMISRTIVLACSLSIVASAMDGGVQNSFVTQPATAIIGRPLTPLSGAGVARRTTRRVIRRSTIYAATLPAGYTTVVVEGTTLYYHAGTYYQPYGNQYVVVYVD